MNSSIDYTATTTQFKADVNKQLYFKKDNNNFINVLSVNQLNTLNNTSLLDIYLSTNHVIEPHYHQNAAELVYCISGSAIVSILNPFTKELSHYTITPGQVANVPQGWWHYEVAKMDHTHLLAIFNAPIPEVILGSDLLTLTPPSILSQTYCIDENTWKQAIAPVKPNTLIGPNCHRIVDSSPYRYENLNNPFPANPLQQQQHIPYVPNYRPY